MWHQERMKVHSTRSRLACRVPQKIIRRCEATSVNVPESLGHWLESWCGATVCLLSRAGLLQLVGPRNTGPRLEIVEEKGETLRCIQLGYALFRILHGGARDYPAVLPEADAAPLLLLLLRATNSLPRFRRLSGLPYSRRLNEPAICRKWDQRSWITTVPCFSHMGMATLQEPALDVLVQWHEGDYYPGSLAVPSHTARY